MFASNAALRDAMPSARPNCAVARAHMKRELRRHVGYGGRRPAKTAHSQDSCTSSPAVGSRQANTESGASARIFSSKAHRASAVRLQDQARPFDRGTHTAASAAMTAMRFAHTGTPHGLTIRTTPTSLENLMKTLIKKLRGSVITVGGGPSLSGLPHHGGRRSGLRWPLWPERQLRPRRVHDLPTCGAALSLPSGS